MVNVSIANFWIVQDKSETIHFSPQRRGGKGVCHIVLNPPTPLDRGEYLQTLILGWLRLAV